MTIATHQAPAAAPQGRTHAAARFLHWLHDDQAGYAEIVAGATDPHDSSKILLLMPTRDRPDVTNTRKWFYLDPERPDLYHQAATYVDALAAQYGNVYTGVRLYDKRARDENKRSEAYTKPGRVIFIDDAPDAPALPYTAAIRTSEHSLHGYYKADQPVTKDDARRAAAALGGDPSGVDLTQLVRVPGTLNTKRGGRWRITTAPSTRTIYPLDQLRATFPAVAPAHKGKGEITDLAWPAVEKHLSNITTLLASGRAACIKPETQCGRILAGEKLIFSVHNRQDDSRSMNGYVLGYGFYLRGFPDAEIAAVMMHHYRAWGMERDKGTAWCKADICRALARMHSEKPGIVQSPTRYTANTPAAQLIEQPAASRARHDRPRQLDPLMLFSRYKADPELCEKKRKDRAAALVISTATLDRLDLALRDMNLIAIEQPGRGLPGRVLILGGVINIGVLSAHDAPIADLGIETTQTDDRNLQCIGGTHQPPETPPTPQPLAAEAVQLETSTGPQAEYRPEWSILSNDKPYTGRHCINFEMRWALSNEAIKLRTDDAGDVADVAEQTEIATNMPQQLSICMPQVCPPAPNDPRYRAFAWRWYASQPGAIDKRTNKPRSVKQAAHFRREALAFCDYAASDEAARRWLAFKQLPVKSKVSIEQADLWQVAERGLEMLRAERHGGGSIGAGVFPQTPAPVADAIDGWATIRRLQQAAIQRQ